MNRLYPLKFHPILKEKIWGGNKLHTILGKGTAADIRCGESWEISGVQENLSVVSNGFLEGNNLEEMIEVYMGELVGDQVYETFGLEFPLLIKFIDASDVLSIQVHPDDALAKERHNAYGKTEMWYIIQADEGSKIITGFNRKISKEIYRENLRNKTLQDILNVEDAFAGDVFFIPAGRVHAIGAGILLTEIQQTSDITYRIYDWDRLDDSGKERELHTDLALDAIDYNQYDQYKTPYEIVPNRSSQVIDCDYFSTNYLKMNQPVGKDFNYIDSFVIYICLSGSFRIEYDGKSEPVSAGESVLIPAILKNLLLIPEKECGMLEVFVKNRSE